MKILYEDNSLMVVEKPVGISSQKSNDGTEDMLSSLEKYRSDKGEDTYVGLVHRLDTATGGAMIYSKKKELVGKLSELVSNGEYSKEYLAVVENAPTEKQGRLVDLLYHDKARNKSYVVDKKRNDVKEAIATYELIKTVQYMERTISLVRVKLITGRTHQIRVQFSSRRMPLLGDGKYGSKDNKTSCALWSNRVEFVHPITKEKIISESYPPNVYPWNLFDLQ